MSTSTRKPFSRELFAANDTLARGIVTAQFAALGIRLVPHTKRYGIDLVLMNSSGVIELGVECEIKRVWSGPVFPYETIQLPERKKKYLSPDYPIEYWLLNNEQTHAIVIPGALVAAATPVEVRNKYVWRGELFYQIPIVDCRLVKLVGVSSPGPAGTEALPETTSSPLAEAGHPAVEGVTNGS